MEARLQALDLQQQPQAQPNDNNNEEAESKFNNFFVNGMSTLLLDIKNIYDVN